MYQTLSMYANEPDVIDAYFDDGLPVMPVPFVAPEDRDTPLKWSDFDFSKVNQFSDLDYKEFRSRLGANYLISTGIRLFASISYYDVEDNAPYLQDLAGSVTLGRLGAIWSF
jgi:hypothetical protein